MFTTATYIVISCRGDPHRQGVQIVGHLPQDQACPCVCVHILDTAMSYPYDAHVCVVSHTIVTCTSCVTVGGPISH